MNEAIEDLIKPEAALDFAILIKVVDFGSVLDCTSPAQ
jgi:hypothetical protein